MRRMGRYCGILAAAMALFFGPAQAQQGRGGPGRGAGTAAGPRVGQSLEMALAHQEELGLTGDQVAQLEELKGVVDGDVMRLADEMKALREGIRSGDIERAEGLRQMEALRGELITAAAPLRGRVQEIFTVEQHRQLQGFLQANRPGRGVAGVAPGRGVGPMQGRNPRFLRGRGDRFGGVAGTPFPRGGVGRQGALGLGQGFPGQGPLRGAGFRGGVGFPRPFRGMAPRGAIGRGWNEDPQF